MDLPSLLLLRMASIGKLMLIFVLVSVLNTANAANGRIFNVQLHEEQSLGELNKLYCVYHNNGYFMLNILLGQCVSQLVETTFWLQKCCVQ